MQSKEHVVQLDYIRTFAIISVVACHVTESIYKLNLKSINELDFLNQVLAFCFFTFGRLGVPLFLFITGYLLLDRDYNNERVVHFWRRNLIPLLLTTVTWIILYNLFFFILNDSTVNMKVLVKELMFLSMVPLGHMWYMPMIIGVYIFIPFVANALKGMSLENILKPYILSVICLMILPCISILRIACKHGVIKSILSLEFSGGIYGLILLTGYIYRKSNYLKKISKRVLLLGLVTFYFSTVYLQIYCHYQGLAYYVWYNNFLLVACSFIVFIMGMQINYSKVYAPPYYTFVKYIAKYSFGVYLVHYPILILLRRCLCFDITKAINVIFYSIVTFVCSYIFVSIFSKYSKIGKILFFIRH